MARFRGTLQGARGQASRLGTVKTGLSVSANGWHIGIRASAGVLANDSDAIDIYVTSGSTGDVQERYIGTARRGKLSDGLDVLVFDDDWAGLVAGVRSTGV